MDLELQNLNTHWRAVAGKTPYDNDQLLFIKKYSTHNV